MKSLLFLKVRSRSRVEQVEGIESRCSQRHTTEDDSEFGLPIIISSQRNISVPRPVRSCCRFLRGSFILSFSLKDMSRSATPNCLLSNRRHARRFLL